MLSTFVLSKNYIPNLLNLLTCCDSMNTYVTWTIDKDQVLLHSQDHDHTTKFQYSIHHPHGNRFLATEKYRIKLSCEDILISFQSMVGDITIHFHPEENPLTWMISDSRRNVMYWKHKGYLQPEDHDPRNQPLHPMTLLTSDFLSCVLHVSICENPVVVYSNENNFLCFKTSNEFLSMNVTTQTITKTQTVHCAVTMKYIRAILPIIQSIRTMRLHITESYVRIDIAIQKDILMTIFLEKLG
jgi:hypothetical protein